MYGRVRTMRIVKGQKTKIRNATNSDDHQRRLTTPISMSMWMIDQGKPDKISSLKCPPRYWLTQHFPVWIYGSFVNRGVLTTEGNIINIIKFQIWSNHQGENTFNIIKNVKTMIKSSGITYNSKLEKILSISSIFKYDQILSEETHSTSSIMEEIW